jgi:hypothetical protein
MKHTRQTLLVAGLLVAPAALAQMAVTGSVTGGYLSSDFKGTNRFRYDEYRDLRSGGTLGAEIKGESAKYFLNFFGENIGRDDQFMELKGGQYGLFNYSLYNNNIIHNLTSNAKTPYGGLNTNSLTFNVAPGLSNSNPVTNPILNTTVWGGFDYSIKHENYGGTFEWKAISSSPFYFRATANQKETKGVKPYGQGVSSPGGQAIELPAVVDYTTTDASVELGYGAKASQYSLNLSWSSFKDNNDFLNWRNPLLTAGTTTERSTLAADSDLWKASLNGVWKQLPMSSTFALRGSYSETSNSLPIASTGLAVSGTTGQVVNMNANRSQFDGKVTNTTLAASLTSVLAKGLDSRVYLNYYDRKNKSSEIVMTPRNAVTSALTQSCDLNPVTGAALTTCTNERFHMTKDNFGLDLQYRANSDNKFSGGWDYTKIERERHDFEKTRDNKFYVEWKNNSLETVTGKVKLQYMDRDADFLLGGLNPLLSANNFYNKNFKRFDLAGNKQTLARFGLDSTPIPFLDLGAELIFKKNDYQDINLGRKNDERKEFYFTAGYGDAKVFRVSVFADYEQTEYVSEHFVGTPPAAYPGGQSTAAYQWSAKVKDKNYVFGVAADWPYSERLKFKGSYIWQQTNGSVDQTAFPGVVFTNITAYDTFRRNTLDLRGVWSVQKNMDLNFGYAYENYRYTDAQMDHYSLTPTNAAGTGNLAILSGAYANPTYRANIFYASLKFMFQ